MALLEVQNLSARYNTGRTLDGVDISVDQGEVVSILGRNGAGKTTTIRCIMGVTPPQIIGGDILFKGESISQMEVYKRAKKGISIVPQERRLWPDLTVRENLKIVINRVDNPLAIDSILAYFPVLEDMIEKYTKNMSGGEQQMVAIARALIVNPEIILMDEPTEGLAPYIIRDLEEIIQSINEEENVTILLVEQDAGVASEVSNNHYILDQGRVVAAMSSRELIDNSELRQKYLGV